MGDTADRTVVVVVVVDNDDDDGSNSSLLAHGNKIIVRCYGADSWLNECSRKRRRGRLARL